MDSVNKYRISTAHKVLGHALGTRDKAHSHSLVGLRADRSEDDVIDSVLFAAAQLKNSVS